MTYNNSLSTYHINSGILLWKHLTGSVCWDLEIGDDSNGLDLLTPGELDVVTNSERRRRGLLSGILTSSWCGEDFTDGDFSAGNVLGSQRLQVGSDESSVQGSSDIVGMSL